MKRLNKTLAGLLAAATSVTMLGGCSAQSGASASAETTGADSDNVLRVAMSADYAPFDWLQEDDSNGAVLTTNGSYMNGYDVLIAKHIAEELGMELSITPMTGVAVCVCADISFTSHLVGPVIRA